MNNRKHNLATFIAALMIILFFASYYYKSFIIYTSLKDPFVIKNEKCAKSKSLEHMSRDFFRYKCKNMKRIGGWPKYINKTPEKLYRIEGAWFVCFDENVAPIENKCKVLSFGINDDDTFDKSISSDFGCQVDAFDPYVEYEFYRNIRSKNDQLKDKISLKVNEKYRFHRIGITGNESVANKNKIGWLTTFDEILNYLKLTNQVIDVLKMDIEEAEWITLKSIDIDYLCKYVKQFLIESHISRISPKISKEYLILLRKLEKCFLLFHRDTRFFQESGWSPYGFQKTEFQEPKSYRMDLNQYHDETDIIDFVVTFGELYFVNENFL
jgi:hypothetical protein